MTAVTTCKHHLERLTLRAQGLKGSDFSKGEQALRDEKRELTNCMDTLRAGIPSFVGAQLSLSGLLTAQADIHLSLGDFDSAFGLLVDMQYVLLFCS